MEVPYLVADPRHGRIIFVAFVKGAQGLNGHNILDAELTGLWEYVPAKGAFRKLTDAHGNVFHWGSKPRAGHLLIATNWQVYDFDLEHDVTTVLTSGYVGVLNSTARRGNGAPTEGRVELSPPFLKLDDWLWSGKPFARTPLSKGPIEFCRLARRPR